MPTLEVDISVAGDNSQELFVGPLSPAFLIDATCSWVCQNGGNLFTIITRFPGITIPNAAIINVAWVRFTSNQLSAGGPLPIARMHADPVDNAVAPTTLAEAQALRLRVVAPLVDWTIPDWAPGEFGSPQQTPEIRTVVQGIVDRAGWASGNALMVVGIGRSVPSMTTARCARLLGNGGTTRLHIDYQDFVPGGGTPGSQHRALLL